MRLRELGPAFYQRVQSYPLLLKAFLLILATMTIFLTISNLTGFKNEELDQAEKEYFATTDTLTIIKNAVLVAPTIEEIKYRGPAWLLLLYFLGLTKLAQKLGIPENRLIHKKTLFSIKRKPIKVFHCAFWLVIIAPTAVWAGDHPYPLPIFVMGLILGWVLIKTKPAFSLLNAIGIHAFWNAFCFAVIWIRSML